MDSNSVRVILIVLGVALLVAIYLWDRLSRRAARKAPRKLKRRPRERRDPGLPGPAPDVDEADEWRVPAEPAEEAEVPVAGVEEEPAPAKRRGLFGRRKRVEREPRLGGAPAGWSAAEEARQPHLPFDEPAQAGEAAVATEEPPKILVINVVAKGAFFGGPGLMRAAEEVGLEPGEWNIFHRPDEHPPHKILFSMANLVEPGSFPFGRMEDFSTPGVCLFTQLPGPRDGLAVYSDMLFSAERIAALLDGELQDETHNLLTRDKIEGVREGILQHKRRLQLAHRAR
jgi:cell division protein ZipA